jgi:5-methylcytosine-specific restriction endonuclease McrA
MPQKTHKARKEYQKRYRILNLDKLKLYEFNRKNKKKIYNKEYSLQNKSKINLKVKERRHLLGISKVYRTIIVGYKSRDNEYGIDWISIRKLAYERDNWTCQECGIKCHGNGTKDKIQCHHIDYNIKNNILKNLVTLCASCHAKTNFGKKEWQSYFKRKE